MKSTNSSFNNTQYFAIVTSTLVALTFGVIFAGILEARKQGLAEVAALRRRLPSLHSSDSSPQRALEKLQQKIDNQKKAMEKLKIEKNRLNEEIQKEDDELRENDYAAWNKKHDETFFQGSFFNKRSTLAKGIAIGSGVVVAGAWVLYSHYAGMEAGGMDTEFNVPAAGCGFGILTTVVFIYILFVISSNHGGRITKIFGETLANSSIVVSSGCLLFGGTSISTLAVCPEIAYVCGALSAGAFFLVLTFWALSHFDIKSGSAEHKGALVVSACMVTGFGLLFFGCMDVSGGFLGIAFGTLILWFAVRKIIQSCRQ